MPEFLVEGPPFSTKIMPTPSGLEWTRPGMDAHHMTIGVRTRFRGGAHVRTDNVDPDGRSLPRLEVDSARVRSDAEMERPVVRRSVHVAKPKDTARRDSRCMCPYRAPCSAMQQ